MILNDCAGCGGQWQLRTREDSGKGVEGRDGRECHWDGGQADLLAGKAEGAAGELQLLCVLIDQELRVKTHRRLAGVQRWGRLRLRLWLLLEGLHLGLACGYPDMKTPQAYEEFFM